MNSSFVGGVTATAVDSISKMLPINTMVCKLEAAILAREPVKDSKRDLMFLDQSDPRCKSLMAIISLLFKSSSNLNDFITTNWNSVDAGSLYLTMIEERGVL